jgi:hypothetical protein
MKTALQRTVRYSKQLLVREGVWSLQLATRGAWSHQDGTECKPRLLGA